MTTNTETSQVRRLRATDLASIDFPEDTRGHMVVDVSGAEVGRVDALFIDEGARKVRFLRVAPVGPAETDAGKFIFPVDAILLIRGGTIYLDRKRSALASAPRDDAQLAVPRNIEFLYEHYAVQPFWRATYEYPPYPFYM
jgi:hypothetical protein